MDVPVASRLGLERPVLNSNFQAQRTHQIVQHVIVLIGNEVVAQLYGHVPVAQVVGGTAELMVVHGVDD